MSRQNDLSLDDDPLEEIRLAWVDDPVPVHFMKHRSLIRYARDLKMITDVMKDYSKSHDCVEKAVLDATLEYGKKAHDVYCNSLHQWLHDNLDSLARDKVESSVRDYPEKGRQDLERYYLRATKAPENRTKSILLSSASKLLKASKDSQSIIEDQRQEILELKRLNELKEIYLDEAQNECQAKQLEVRRKAIELKKKQIDVDAYKELAEDTISIADVLDFNKFCSKYKQFLDKDKGVSMGGPAIPKTPGGHISLIKSHL